jgi:hypothetical protein
MTTLIKSRSNFLARPFDGIEQFEDVLDTTIVKIGNDEIYQPGSIELPSSRLPLSEGQIEIYFAPSLLENLNNQNMDPKSVVIVCFIQGTVIAESQIIYQEKLSTAKSPVVVPLHGNPLITQSPNGFDIRIALILTKDRVGKDVELIEAGVWLANIIFRISPYSAQSLFAAAPLDDQLRTSFGLPKGCLSYVHIQDDFMLSESLEDQVDIYIDVSVLRLLQESQDSAVANSIQLDLATSLFLALICKTATYLRDENIEDSEDFELENLPVGKVLHHVSVSSKYSIDDLLKFAANDLGRLKAAIETHLGSLKYASAALREVS